MSFRFLLVLALIGGAFFKGQDFYKAYRLNREMKSVQAGVGNKADFGIPNSCLGKKFCITVFVAPWCPACKASQGSFSSISQYLPQNRPDIGFGVVIGNGSLAENNAEKEVLSNLDVQTDNTGLIFKKRNISSFPTWVVNDQTGKEIFRESAGLQVSPAQVPQLLSDFFKI